MLGHGVKGAAVLEPLELGLVEGVGELDVEGLAAVLGVDAEGHWLADGELGAHEVKHILGLDLVVVGWVGEGKRKHTLLLQVGLVLHLVLVHVFFLGGKLGRVGTNNTSEGSGDDSQSTEMSWLQSGVFTRATLTVVPVTDDNPLDSTGLVVTSGSWDSIVLSGDEVLDAVSLTVLGIGSTDKQVVGDVVKMSTVFQPWASHCNE